MKSSQQALYIAQHFYNSGTFFVLSLSYAITQFTIDQSVFW